MRGGFGVRLTGLLQDDVSLPFADASWTPASWEWLEGRKATTPLQDGSRWFDVADTEDPSKPSDMAMLVHAERRHFALVGPHRPSREALLHPWLTTVAAAVAFSEGHDAWHGGSLVVEGRVWGVLGEREAGKTTLLAWALARGEQVGADDLIVLRNETALSGPTCLDLREPAARALGLGQRTEVMPGRTRWRLTGPPLPAELPFAGFVLPTWSDTVSVEPLAPRERVPRLASNSYAWPLTGREGRLLDLLDYPVLRWSRPRDFAATDCAGEALLERLSNS